MPSRTTAPSNGRPSDLVNLMFVGSREQISSAFRAAGWSEAAPCNMHSRIRGVRAFVEGRGSESFPMSALLLNDAEADMSWQKGLNDMSKRHHIRIWKQPQMWDGQEVWAARGDARYRFRIYAPRFGDDAPHRRKYRPGARQDRLRSGVYIVCRRAGLGGASEPAQCDAQWHGRPDEYG